MRPAPLPLFAVLRSAFDGPVDSGDCIDSTVTSIRRDTGAKVSRLPESVKSICQDHESFWQKGGMGEYQGLGGSTFVGSTPPRTYPLDLPRHRLGLIT